MVYKQTFIKRTLGLSLNAPHFYAVFIFGFHANYWPANWLTFPALITDYIIGIYDIFHSNYVFLGTVRNFHFHVKFSVCARKRGKIVAHFSAFARNISMEINKGIEHCARLIYE